MCGQCCVAMLTGSSLKRVLYIVGHDHGTKTKELALAIRLLGFDCRDRLRHVKHVVKHLYKTDRALVKLTIKHSSSWHWVAWIENKIYDPSKSYPVSLFSSIDNERIRPTSYLEIENGTKWAPVDLRKEAIMTVS